MWLVRLLWLVWLVRTALLEEAVTEGVGLSAALSAGLSAGLQGSR